MISSRDAGRAETKVKRCSAALAGFDPDTTTVALENPSTNRETHSGPLILRSRVQPVKYFEDPVRIFVRDSDSVIPNRKDTFVVVKIPGDVNARNFVAAILQRISNQILKHKCKLFVGQNPR